MRDIIKNLKRKVMLRRFLCVLFALILATTSFAAPVTAYADESADAALVKFQQKYHGESYAVLSDAEKAIFDGIVKYHYQLTEGYDSSVVLSQIITIPNVVITKEIPSGMNYQDEGNAVLKTVITNVLRAICLEVEDIFWLDKVEGLRINSNIETSGGNVVVSQIKIQACFRRDFLSADVGIRFSAIHDKYVASDAFATRIASLVSAESSDFDKLKTIAGALADRLTYKHDIGANDFFAAWHNIDAIVGLNESNGVVLDPAEIICEGYAKLFKFCCRYVGLSSSTKVTIETGMISKDCGASYGNHLWTTVYLDGNWYIFDMTATDGNYEENSFILNSFDKFVEKCGLLKGGSTTEIKDSTLLSAIGMESGSRYAVILLGEAKPNSLVYYVRTADSLRSSYTIATTDYTPSQTQTGGNEGQTTGGEGTQTGGNEGQTTGGEGTQTGDSEGEGTGTQTGDNEGEGEETGTQTGGNEGQGSGSGSTTGGGSSSGGGFSGGGSSSGGGFSGGGSSSGGGFSGGGSSSGGGFSGGGSSSGGGFSGGGSSSGGGFSGGGFSGGGSVTPAAPSGESSTETPAADDSTTAEETAPVEDEKTDDVASEEVKDTAEDKAAEEKDTKAGDESEKKTEEVTKVVPETAVEANIKKNKDGSKTLVDESGKKLNNEIANVNGTLYFADKKGKIVTNKIVKDDDGNMYFATKSGKLAQNKVVTAKNGAKYFTGSDGKVVKKQLVTAKNGAMYYAQKNGKLAKSKWVTIKGIQYYCNKNGKVTKQRPVTKK